MDYECPFLIVFELVFHFDIWCRCNNWCFTLYSISGESSSPNECWACWKWPFYLWCDIKVKNQVFGELSWCLSCWKVTMMLLFNSVIYLHKVMLYPIIMLNFMSTVESLWMFYWFQQLFHLSMPVYYSVFNLISYIYVHVVFIICRTHVTLKKDGVVLDLVPPPTKVNNLIFGRTWVDSPGEMIMTNLTTGDKVVLYFQPCGWFG